MQLKKLVRNSAARYLPCYVIRPERILNGDAAADSWQRLPRRSMLTPASVGPLKFGTRFVNQTMQREKWRRKRRSKTHCCAKEPCSLGVGRGECRDRSLKLYNCRGYLTTPHPPPCPTNPSSIIPRCSQPLNGWQHCHLATPLYTAAVFQTLCRIHHP